MRKLNLNNVEEASEFKKVTPGLYIAKIVEVEDVPEREYLKIKLDIAVGEFKNYYTELNESRGFWALTLIRSYKKLALPFFKAFVTATEKSNANYKFDEDKYLELKGKLVGVVLSEEEYKKADGTIGGRIVVNRLRSVDEIKKGNIEIPELKKLVLNTQETIAVKDGNFVTVEDDDELPF